MIQQLLLAGQVLVIVLVYVFVWRVMRTARRDLAGGSAQPLEHAASDLQESTIIPPSEAVRARRAAGFGDPRVVVEASGVLRAGMPIPLGTGITIGRASDNDVVIDDGVVSGHHLRLVPPATLVDLDSTNGTLVNGAAVRGQVSLSVGDLIAIGDTVLRYEVAQ